jgi:hypothetical protein
VKDIDPEVAALLDDIPKAKLPKALEQEGWSRFTVQQMRSAGKVPKAPSPEQAPKYLENCIQCGRPVTNARKGGGFWDHAGGMACDGALVDEQDYSEHVTQSYLDEMKAYKAELARGLYGPPVDPPRVRQKDKRFQDLVKEAKAAKARREAPCSATQYRSSCQHECSQRGEHFGFHECKYCRHLWK